MVEKCQRLTPGMTFEPESHAAEINGKRVLVNAIDAVRDDIAGCFTDSFRGRLILTCAKTSKLFT
ncbi:MAG: hypothetical protein HBSIN02_06260 [Bacteroidia bacterium]|nr:MAG: hypothetical protein HBSIN02_06260 [Bacteroidia bacterium]